VWVGSDGRERSGPWREVAFERADSATRAAEPADRAVQRVVGQQHADRARRSAIALSRKGDLDGARGLIRRVTRRIAEYAGTDPSLQQALAELGAAERELVQHGYRSEQGKEVYFAAQTRSRGQRDLRPS
jgi:hypothetical protein